MGDLKVTLNGQVFDASAGSQITVDVDWPAGRGMEPWRRSWSVVDAVKEMEARAVSSGRLDEPPVERGVIGLLHPLEGAAQDGGPGGWFVEAVRGWRVWRLELERGDAVLRSVWTPHEWKAGEVFTSECRCPRPFRADRPVPHQCGIHAWRSPTAVVRDGLVSGEVWLFGEVAVHEIGYRARHAQVAALHVPDEIHWSWRNVIELAARQYGVPIVDPTVRA